MDADPAAANHINKLEHSSPTELLVQLPLLFEKILDPDQEPKFTYSYVVRSIDAPNLYPISSLHGRLARYPKSFLS